MCEIWAFRRLYEPVKHSRASYMLSMVVVDVVYEETRSSCITFKSQLQGTLTGVECGSGARIGRFEPTRDLGNKAIRKPSRGTSELVGELAGQS